MTADTRSLFRASPVWLGSYVSTFGVFPFSYNSLLSCAASFNTNAPMDDMLGDFDPSAFTMPEIDAERSPPGLSTLYNVPSLLVWILRLTDSQDLPFNNLVTTYNNHMTSGMASALVQPASRTEASRYATLSCGFFWRTSHHNLLDRPPRSDAISVGS